MYEDSERLIFRYRLGDQERMADPLAVFRAINEHPEIDLESDLKRIDTDIVATPDLESLGRLTDATRKAFGLQSFDGATGQGVLDFEVQQILAQFLHFMAGIAKKKSQTPTLQQSTVSDADQTTKPTSDCGCIGSGN